MAKKPAETTMERLIREAIESGEFDMSKLNADPNDSTLVRGVPEGTEDESAEVEEPPAPPKPARSVTEY